MVVARSNPGGGTGTGGAGESGMPGRRVPGPASLLFRLSSLGLSLIAAYGVIMFSGDEGAGPAALLLIFGWKSELAVSVWSGWVGILGVTLVFTAARTRRRAAWSIAAGVLGLFVSWSGIVLQSRSLLFTVMTSIPFLVLLGWFGMRSYQYVGLLEREA